MVSRSRAVQHDSRGRHGDSIITYNDSIYRTWSITTGTHHTNSTGQSREIEEERQSSFTDLESSQNSNMQLIRYWEATETSRVYTLVIGLRFKREIEYIMKAHNFASFRGRQRLTK
jgi:hypothetical protein